MAPQTRHPTALGLALSQSLSQGLDEAVLRCHRQCPGSGVFSAWCHNRQEDPASCPIELVLCFLQSLLDLKKKMAPSTIKVYTAAISFLHEAVEDVTVGRYPIVSQFIKRA